MKDYLAFIAALYAIAAYAVAFGYVSHLSLILADYPLVKWMLVGILAWGAIGCIRSMIRND